MNAGRSASLTRPNASAVGLSAQSNPRSDAPIGVNDLILRAWQARIEEKSHEHA
ncbi:MAG: hypothetical protein WDN46_08445 [Methylocella sp.]